MDLAKRIDVRVTFGYLDERDDAGNPYPFNLTVAAEYMRGIEDLLFLCAVTDWGMSPGGVSLNSADGFVRNVYMRRISYNSPFEVVFWFGAIGAGITVANRLVNLWSNIQIARRTTSETNVRVAVANVLQATIDAPIPIQPGTIGYDRFLLAGQVLDHLSELEVNEEA